MEQLERDGFAKLRSGKTLQTVRWIIAQLGEVAEDAGEDSLQYLVACYRGAKVLAAAGHADGAIKVLNLVPKKAVEQEQNKEMLGLLALEFGEGMRKLGDAQTAERIVGLGHGLRAELFGPNHPKTALSALLAARVCFDLERWTDAARFFENSLMAFGPYHPFGAVACADRAFLVSAGSQDAFPFPKFVMRAPLGYWRDIVNAIANTTLHVSVDLRLAVLLNVSSELHERVEGSTELVRTLLCAAYRHAQAAHDERAQMLEELLRENQWEQDTQADTVILSPNQGSDTQAFWRCPDRDSEIDEIDGISADGTDGMHGWFRLFEGVAAMRTGELAEAKHSFQCVIDRCGEQHLQYWSAKGCMRFMDRGGRLGCGAFNPQPRALEALALSKMSKTLQAKIQGLELNSKDGQVGVEFVGGKLTEAQQARAMKAVEQALSWILDQTDKPG